MPKEKISATVDPDRLELARSLVHADTVSGLLDEALRALIDREQERRWLDAHSDKNRHADLPPAVAPDLRDLPWDD